MREGERGRGNEKEREKEGGRKGGRKEGREREREIRYGTTNKSSLQAMPLMLHISACSMECL